MKVFQHVGMAVSAVLFTAGAAAAQSMAPIPAASGYSLGPQTSAPEFTTIMGHARPDYDRLGIRAGGFLLYPSASLSETYDSNIFATRTGTADDFYTTLAPSLSIVSDWSRHAAALNASGQFKWYASHESENANNAAVNLQGRVDIETGSYIALSGDYSLLHEDRASPDSFANIKQPTQYTTSTAYLGYVRDEGRIGLHVDASATSYSFNNNTTFGGQNVNEVDRDRIEYTGALRASYEIIPQQPYQAFVRIVGNSRQYNSIDVNQLALNGVSARRNSKGFEVDAGTAVEITRILTGDVYVGYLEQDYQSSIFRSTSGVGFGGDLLWSITDLTSIKGAFSQSVVETDILGASSAQETNVSLSVEHELRRNIVLVGSVGYVHDDYQGITRSDDTYGAGVGARYFLNRVWRATADVSYAKRSSNAGADYSRVIATVGVEAGF
jgi:hypothetical protein